MCDYKTLYNYCDVYMFYSVCVCYVVIGFVSYLFVIAPLLFLNYLLFGSLIKIFFWYSKTTCGIDLYMFHFSMPPRKEPPPPPPPTVEALLALLMEDRQATRAESAATIAALQQLAAANANNNNGNGHGARSKLKDFQQTNSPVFSKIVEPLDADDWLRTIANNLEVAAVDEADKVLFATHFLAGPARTWWETTRDTVAAGHVFTWEDFVARFRKYHIPQGVMGIMRDKFLKLRHECQ